MSHGTPDPGTPPEEYATDQEVTDAVSGLEGSLDDTFATDQEVTDAIEAVVVGTELGHAETGNNFTTTNTTYAGTASTAKVTGLVVVVDNHIPGRPVEVEAFLSSVRDSSATPAIGAYILHNGSPVAFAWRRPGDVANGDSMLPRRRLVLGAGEHTFEVGVYGSAAGTITVVHLLPDFPSWLAVTQR